MELRDDIRRSRGPAAAFAAVGLYWGSFAALAPQLKAQTGLSDAGFGLALLVGALGAVAAMWLAPRAEARLGRHAMPVLALLLAAAFLLPGLTTGGVAFALAMLAASGASGTLDVVMNARVSQIEAAENRPLMNLNHAIFSFAYAAAALLAGLGREAGLAPATLFALAGVVTLGLTRVTYSAPEIHDGTTADPGEVEPAPLPPLVLMLGGAIVLIAFMSEQATEGWSALHLERNLAAGAAQGALGPAVLGLTMGIGRLSGQLLMRHLSEGRVMGLASALAALGALIAAWSPALAPAYLGFAILGLGVSVVAPMAFGWIGRQVAHRHRMHAISRVSVIGYSGFFIGPPMMGFVAQGFGLPMAFTAIALCLLSVPVLLVPALRRSAAPG
ncbi:MFS transporter [Cribrihabitans marinus]|nr:MFS transporter [Cribrihabitans marinus]